MRKLLVLLCSTFVLLTGCGKDEGGGSTANNIDFRALALYNQFKADLHSREIFMFDQRINTVEIVFEEFETDQYAGFCDYDSNRVRINSKSFDDWAPYFPEMVVYHELGHCILGLPHSTGIMAPFFGLPEYQDYLDNREDRIEELFEDFY